MSFVEPTQMPDEIGSEGQRVNTSLAMMFRQAQSVSLSLARLFTFLRGSISDVQILTSDYPPPMLAQPKG